MRSPLKALQKAYVQACGKKGSDPFLTVRDENVLIQFQNYLAGFQNSHIQPPLQLPIIRYFSDLLVMFVNYCFSTVRFSKYIKLMNNN